MAPPQLIRGGIPLTSVRGLNASQIRTLNDLWISTAQELAGVYGASEPVRSRLAATLGIQRSALDPIATAAQRLIPLMYGAPSRAELWPAQSLNTAWARYWTIPKSSYNGTGICRSIRGLSAPSPRQAQSPRSTATLAQPGPAAAHALPMQRSRCGSNWRSPQVRRAT